MNMHDLHDEADVADDLSTLAWVHDELRRSLEAAHKSLRRYLKEADAVSGSDVDAVDPAVLRAARAQLHQGVGALDMIGLPGPARVLRASESVVQRFIAKPRSVSRAAVEALESASFGVLDYLGRKLAGKGLPTLALFPQYRKLLELAGADRVHPADLWRDDWQWQPLPADASATSLSADAATRTAMETQVLAIMRGADRDAMQRLSDLCAGLGAASEGQVAGLWQLAAGFYEAQAVGALQPDVYAKRVSSRLLAQLRLSIAGPAEASQRLAQDVLFFCAHARAPGQSQRAPRLEAVREAYDLDASAAFDYQALRLGRFDPAWIAQARKRVAGAKEVWSAVAGGEMHRLGGLAEQFALVGDSLKRLYPSGEQLADALQAAVTQPVAAAQTPHPALAMEVATSVLYLDASLEDGEFDHPLIGTRVQRLAQRIGAVGAGQAAQPLEPWMEELYRRVSDRQTMGSVVQELRASLSEAEKQIDQYFRDPSQRELLIPVPGQLQAMRGVLSVLDMEHASQAVLRMSEDVDALAAAPVDAQAAARDGSFTRLADNLGALSFMIDMLSVQPQMARSLFRFDAQTGNLRAVMGQRSRRLSAFGGFDELQAGAPALAAQARSLALAQPDLPDEQVQQELRRLSQQALLADQAMLAETIASAQQALQRAADAETREKVRSDLVQAVAELAAPAAPDEPALQQPVRATPPPQPEVQGSTGLEEDDEMREIFIEEAREVVQGGREALARLADAPDELGDLTLIRRAFHTLKGSSRMVGLQAFGETAWSCEQLYNVRLAESAQLEGDLAAFSRVALDELGAWVETIAERAAPPADGGAALRARADALRLRSTAPAAPSAPTPAEATAALLQRVPQLPSADDLMLEFDLDMGTPPADVPWHVEPPHAEPPHAEPSRAELPHAELPHAAPTARPRDEAEPADAAATVPAALLDADFDLSPAPAAAAAAPPPLLSLDLAPHDDAFALDFGHAVDSAAGSVAASLADTAVPPPLVEPAPEAAVGPAQAARSADPAELVEAGRWPGEWTDPIDPGDLGNAGDLDDLGDLGDFATSGFDLSLGETAEPDVAAAAVPHGNAAVAPHEEVTSARREDAAAPHEEAAAPHEEAAAPHAAVAAAPHDQAAEAPPVLDEDQVKVIGELRIGIPLFNIYLNEADEWSRRLCTEISEWAMAPERAPDEGTAALAHSLAGSSATVGYADLSTLARALEHALMRCIAVGGGAPGEAPLFLDAAEEIRRLLHQFAAGFLRPAPAELLQRLHAHELALSAPLAPSAVAAVEHGTAAAPVALQPPPYAPRVLPVFSDELGQPALTAFGELPQPALPRTWAHVDADVPDDADDIDAVDAIDEELFPIFQEEGGELLPQLQAQLRDWAHRPGEPAAAVACMRTLHTFKGGARLAGAMRLGEMVHRMEAAIEHLIHRDASAADIEALLARADALSSCFEQLGVTGATGVPGTSAAAPVASDAAPPPVAAFAVAFAAVSAAPLPAAPPPRAEADADADASGATGAGHAGDARVDPAGDVPPPDMAPRPAAGLAPSAPIDWSRFSLGASLLPAAAERAVASGAAVRVRAPLLDRLVNHAGEVSITRSRIESDVGQIRGSLGDLGENLERLRRQLRDLELQAESQIASRLEAAKAAQQFDPLEMDRFTRFQELTRMMAESVNDVATVQRGLQRALQATEDELASQARLTRDLQDDLLRTRMVEFESMADRLYRVVRQAAKETGKQVRLDIVGGAIEIDRGVLDRMIGPFEHLLRNSVAHGIEPPDVRSAAGKDATGTISIHLQQEGNEVAVAFRDDCAGLNLQRIRARAVAQGLIAADDEPPEAELANLIFAPGFSTVEQVSELAGRGVGMDVVRAEVNAMGGRIETATAAGQGASFRLVLPLTTAVTQVVMLRCGELRIAVPSTLVEMVRRVPVDELERCYGLGAFTLGERVLPFFWLGALLQAGARGASTGRSQPVVVIRSASQRVALHVDEVLGNQEVVVKNLGPQLSRLPGLAGITLLPSGAVALIYNPVALATLYGDAAREQLRRSAGADEPVAASAAQAPPAPLVLVVDDSLTVRRVTQRLLVREGYRVALAKDGLDALDQLGGELPAVVLSDIEMPRMDGFDLMRNLRSDARLAALPVIMITSRIAQKHRDYAAELGVDHYLGKPYAEDELLSLVGRYAPLAATH